MCLSSIATGAHPDVHHIPHLVWYDRERARLVEYGSSFAAVRAAGMARSILDTIINMNRLHLGPDAVTIYEALEDAGLTTAAINITCYRGRTPHLPTLPGLTIPAYGPKRFFFYNLFESDPTGAPLAVFGRAQGSIDAYAAAVGRWLVTRDGFDFLVYYLPDYDFASHAHGPDEAFEALARSDAGDRRAPRRGRRPGRVPRALCGRALLGSRPDARRPARAVGVAVRGIDGRARHRVESGRDDLPPARVQARTA